MFELTPENLWNVIEELRRERMRNKTVHCIMNYVAANDCANALLAVGARPVMADCLEECGEITAKASALVLNMGTFSPSRGQAMLTSGKAANKAHIPIIIDPVGLQASALRRRFFKRLTNDLRVTAVKGNLHEIAAVVGWDNIKGVTFGDDNSFDLWLAENAARKLGCAVLLTGERDCLSNGEQTFILENGSQHMAAVTGTGCMTGALIGACAAAVGDGMTACSAAVSLINICGEIAAEDFHGTASFRIDLTDNLSQITREQYLQRVKIKRKDH